VKTRLDQLLLNQQVVVDLSAADRLIRAGKVLVNEELIDKPGTLVVSDSSIRIKTDPKYVSRGGIKLEKGLDCFRVNPTNMTCIDVGVSSGGFTDCLLQHGARRVYGVDVGYGQIAWKLRQDARVILLERFNVRKITTQDITEKIELAVIDVSFISLTKVIPPLLPLFGSKISIIALIKPQFELPREKIGKGGVVKDSYLHQEAVDKIKQFGDIQGLETRRTTSSPIPGAKGNLEFLIHLAQTKT